MKILKYAVWIAVIFLFQTVVANEIKIMAIVPNVVLPFVVLVAVKEDDFWALTAVSAVCAVMAGALCAKSFFFEVLFYTYLSALVFNLRKRMRRMPDFMRYIIWILPSAAITEIAGGMMTFTSFDIFNVYPVLAVLYTFAMALLLYPIASPLLYGRNKVKKQLIVK